MKAILGFKLGMGRTDDNIQSYELFEMTADQLESKLNTRLFWVSHR